MKLMTALAMIAITALSAVAANAAGRTIILFPGVAGAVPDDFLMRNRASFDRLGTVVVSLNGEQAAGVARAERQKGNKVFLVGMSAGALKVGGAIRSGAQVDAAVLVSGNYQQVMGAIGNPSSLPPTLIVHNPADACPNTPASAASAFSGWARGKVTVRLTAETGNAPPAGACGPRGAHGFFMQDGAAIAAISQFISSR